MRSSGILLPVFSLPGEYGIGSLSHEAYDFVDWLSKSGQRYWQILPLGPVGFGESPYQSLSTFAGNALLLSVDDFVRRNLLTKEEALLLKRPFRSEIDYPDVIKSRRTVFKKAYSRFNKDDDFYELRSRIGHWLDDYCAYRVLKDLHGERSWCEWDDKYRLKDPEALKEVLDDYSDEAEFYAFLEYEFYRQWKALKSYANNKGIKIIGDLPIYVSMDSADAWSNPELFQFDEDLNPIFVAGCPPDYFSRDGQLWGNPVYDWDAHKKTGYEWWIKRLEHCFDLYDMVRLDHFRGFESYYTIKYGAKNARVGQWVPGPGMDFFAAVKAKLPDAPIIAEDLGTLSDEVFKLIEDSGYPGMKVLQFAFDDYDGPYLPYKFSRGCVVYTGTHDNDTLYGWLNKANDDVIKFIRDYTGMTGASKRKLAFSLIRLAMASTADTCVIPVQDYLCLGSSARINTPSTVGNNWKWKLGPGILTDELAESISEMTFVYGRKVD